MRFLACLMCLGLTTAHAADVTRAQTLALAQAVSPPDQQTVVAKSQESESVGVDAERKALAFIREHQPKLLKLMSFLKEKQPLSYQQALREMGRSQQRLEALKKRDPELYAVELELWQLRSRLRMLAAEMSVSKEPNRKRLDAELAKLVEQQSRRELLRLQLMRDRAARQVARLDEEIAQRNAQQDDYVAKSIRSWHNKIKKQKSSENQQ